MDKLMLTCLLVVMGLSLLDIAGAAKGDTTLVFSLDQGFGNGVVVQDDPVAVKRMADAVKSLETRYKVYFLVNPMVKDRARLERTLDTLVGSKVPFMFDVYSSDTMTLGSCSAEAAPHDPTHGIAISLDDLKTYKERYGQWLVGLRVFEVFAIDFIIRAVKTTNPEWGLPCWKMPSGSFFEPEFVEPYLAFAKQNGMFVQWCDWHWSAFADWDAPLKEHEAKLATLLGKYPGLVTVTYANNEPDGKSADRLAAWEKSVAGFARSGTANIGLSDQSWTAKEEQTCPVETIITWATDALNKGYRFVQFEPAWYFFKLPRGTFGLQDYKSGGEYADAGVATANLAKLKEALMHYERPAAQK